MKKSLILILLFILSLSLLAQGKYSRFYYQRASAFEQLPTSKKDIIFLGNSITQGGDWAELFNNKHVKNRGISGDVTQGVYDRLDAIIKGQPKKVFLLIGVNDLSQGFAPYHVVNNLKKIVNKIQTESPRTKIYLQSILPVNSDFETFASHTSKTKEIKEANDLMKALAKEKLVKYIDLYSHFVIPSTDKLNPEYTNDGLHIMGAGYTHWRDLLKSYVK